MALNLLKLVPMSGYFSNILKILHGIEGLSIRKKFKLTFHYIDIMLLDRLPSDREYECMSGKCCSCDTNAAE